MPHSDGKQNVLDVLSRAKAVCGEPSWMYDKVKAGANMEVYFKSLSHIKKEFLEKALDKHLTVSTKFPTAPDLNKILATIGAQSYGEKKKEVVWKPNPADQGRKEQFNKLQQQHTPEEIEKLALWSAYLLCNSDSPAQWDMVKYFSKSKQSVVCSAVAVYGSERVFNALYDNSCEDVLLECEEAFKNRPDVLDGVRRNNLMIS